MAIVVSWFRLEPAGGERAVQNRRHLLDLVENEHRSKLDRHLREQSVQHHTRSPGVDLLVRNGVIYDGRGGAPVRGDVAVRDGRVVATGTLRDYTATREVDAESGPAESPCTFAPTRRSPGSFRPSW